MSGDGEDFISTGVVVSENTDGTLNYTPTPLDLTEIFHPLQDGSTPVAETGILLHGKDLSEIFEPVSSGRETAYNTGYMTSLNRGSSTDLKSIFAAKDTINQSGELSSIQRGDFTCDTHLHVYLDTSGSMSTALSYVEPAIVIIQDFFTDVFYGGDKTKKTTYVKKFKKTNEKVLDWLGAAADTRDTAADPPRECTIAFINESNSKGVGNVNIYKDRHEAVTNLGGVKYGAIGGVVGYAAYPGEVQAYLDGPTATLRDIGVQDFWNISNSTATWEYVDMIVKWLNIPTQPSDLNPTVQSLNSGGDRDTVSWKFDDYICGLTHAPGQNSNDYVKTQEKWTVDVSTDASYWSIVETAHFTTNRPETYTYTPPKPGPLKYYCMLKAIGETGYTSKNSSWVECELQDTPPVLTLLGDASVTVA